MKIAILHQAVPPGAREDERDVLDQAAAVRGALQGAGHETVTLPVSLDLEALTAALRREAPARVFNLVESLGGTDRLLPMVPALLEQLGIPCTGNPADALLVTTHKLLAKQRLRQGGLPTPDWIEAGAEGELINAETQRRRGEEGADSAALSPIPLRAAETNGDWILKPVWEHASAGLAGDNLLRGVPRAQAARRRAELAGDRADAWYAERFIEGREFNVALLGRTGAEPEILPPAEILFVDFPPEKPRILDYEAKWNTASFAYTHTPRTFALPAADAPLAGRLRELARACWRLFGLGGAARVDFRVDATGRPWILEVNANPCLAPDAGFAAALREARIPYAQAILALVDAAAPIDPDQPRSTPINPNGSGGLESTGRNVCATLPGGTGASALNKPPALVFRESVAADDPRRIRELVSATGFFHADEVAVAEELVTERLRLGEASGYLFLLAEDAAGRLAGYACFGPTPCTASSYDLYWIAVDPAFQKGGLGRELSRRCEAIIRQRGGTRLYAETSNRPQYASTRAFYERTGYRLASLLDDFYAPGDGKATYLKVLE